MKLLMVNDEELTVETMKTDIAWEKYGIDEVYTAYDVEQGKAQILKHPIDILLCDIEMPGENGIALLKWVRETGREIECIFLTCHASFAYAQEAIGLDCQDYILIPAKYEDIGNAVLKVVKRIRERQNNLRLQEYGKQVIKEKMEKSIETYGEKKTPKELAAAMESLIMERLGDESLNMNEIAEQMHLHSVYLNRIFKKEKGISVGQYIIRQRMELAADLLRAGKLSANAIAETVGYKSYSNFNLAFNKYYGCSPSRFLEMNKTD